MGELYFREWYNCRKRSGKYTSCTTVQECGMSYRLHELGLRAQEEITSVFKSNTNDR